MASEPSQCGKRRKTASYMIHANHRSRQETEYRPAVAGVRGGVGVRAVVTTSDRRSTDTSIGVSTKDGDRGETHHLARSTNSRQPIPGSAHACIRSRDSRFGEREFDISADSSIQDATLSVALTAKSSRPENGPTSLVPGDGGWCGDPKT